MQLATRRWRETPLTVVLLVLLGLLSTLFLTQTTPGWLSPSFGSSSLPRLQPYNCVDGASITSTLNDDNITIDYGPWTEFSSLVESRRKSFQPLLSKVIYRVAMCTITRNELHLKEWLVRNTLMGFEHFFIFDTNQVRKGLFALHRIFFVQFERTKAIYNCITNCFGNLVMLFRHFSEAVFGLLDWFLSGGPCDGY
jgi:hypothetical protein